MDDTETLLALLSSLVDLADIDQTTLLEALVDCDGDVHRAAKRLSKGTVRRNTYQEQATKRKRPAGLDEWLQLSPKKAAFSSIQSSSKRAVITSPRDSSPSRRPESLSSGSTSTANTTLFHRNTPEAYPSASEHASLSGGPAKSARVVTNTEFMSMFRSAAPEGLSKQNQTPPRAPPLTLATPSLVAQHTPCTLHYSVLPPELACRLFYDMLEESQNWSRNKWWLFDRVVESPHRTSFYVRRAELGNEDLQQAAQYWYNGKQVAPPPPFPHAMEAACEIVEKVVNAEMRKRKRFALEWGGEAGGDSDDPDERIIWRANVAAANCYEGAKESVGFHSDQLTSIGPYPTIASLSLGTSRMFRLREVVPSDEKDERKARTYNIPLRHNSLIIMHASTQEVFKHCVPPQNAIDMFHPPFPPPSAQDSLASSASNCRINITFRFFRPDFRASTTPKCRCGVPCILRPDMKNRYSSADGDDEQKEIVAKYWWTCYAGAQNDGKGCNFWKVMDVEREGRGPFVGSPGGQ